MNAAVADECKRARGTAEGDQVLAEESHPEWRAIGLELPRVHEGQPVVPHQLAHRRAGADLGEFRAFDRGGHGGPYGCVAVQRIARSKECRRPTRIW